MRRNAALYDLRRSIRDTIGLSLIDEPDPVRFARRILGIHPWKGQRQFLRMVAAGHRRVACGTGHGTGKTLAGAILICWWLATAKPDTLIISSAPTGRQVELLLWREVNVLWGKSAVLRKLTRPRRRFIEVSRDRAAYGFSTDDPDRFQGLHAAHLRILVDEANGFPEDIWLAIDACLTGKDVQVVSIGNTLEAFGSFHRSFSDPSVRSMILSSRLHPNVRSSRVLIPGAVTRDWVEDFEHKYASSPAVIAARVDAIFPEESEDGVISRAMLARARTEVISRTFKPAVLAVDVARYGEALTVCTRMLGQHVEWQRGWGKTSVADTAARITTMYHDNPVDYIVVDDDGVGGGVTDILETSGLPVVAFRGGMRAESPERFKNRISEAYWSMRELMSNTVLELSIPPGIIDQQLVMRRYRLMSDKLIQIERKEEYSRRTGLPSPDESDSLAMAAWQVMRIWREMAVYA